MSDLTNRLRGKYSIGPSGVFENRDFGSFTPAICKEAADLIDQLEADNKALALEVATLNKALRKVINVHCVDDYLSGEARTSAVNSAVKYYIEKVSEAG